MANRKSITLEVETDLPIRKLKQAWRYWITCRTAEKQTDYSGEISTVEVVQVLGAGVVQPAADPAPKPAKRQRKKAAVKSMPKSERKARRLS